MAKIRVLNTKSALHDVVAVEGLRELSFSIEQTEKEFGSDGEPTESEAVDFKVTGEAVFEDVAAYNAVLGNDQSNLVVVGVTEGGGADKTFTLKNCMFTGARAQLPTRQDRGVGTYRCPFRCTPGSSDTPDTMVTVT